MKRLFGIVVLSALVGGLSPASAQSSFTFIEEDTTWTKAGSPYELESVFVAPGVTLTIEPGVRVEIDELTVSGGLRADGTEPEPILFSAPEGETWAGITFIDRDEQRPVSSISNAVIERSRRGLRMGEDSFPVHDTLFSGNGSALRVNDPERNVTFTGNEFYSNGTAFSGKATGIVGLYKNDFWDNDVSLLFRAHSPYSCITDVGLFDVHYNDLLRGPDAEWYSFDVRTSPASEGRVSVDASSNWWGSTVHDDITGRLEPHVNCCPTPPRERISWQDPAALPQTEKAPPGPAGTPEEEPNLHGDPPFIPEVRSPRHAECPRKGTVTRIRGLVHPAVGAMPRTIDISLLLRGRGQCRFWDPETRRFGPRTGCDDKKYFDVRVRDRRWRVDLARPLHRGRYSVFTTIGTYGIGNVDFRVI